MKKEFNIIEFQNITKTFLGGKLIANDNVSFKIKNNTIHAIAGENGAGKSTLLSILFGLYSADGGQIVLRRYDEKNDQVLRKVANYKGALDAINDGLGMVQQHFQLVDRFTVGENILLGNEPTKFGFKNFKAAYEKIDNLAKKYKFNVQSKQVIKKLTVGQEQKTEILKLLYRDSNILIFDEPTAVLTQEEIKSFLEILKSLKENGKTVILITHKYNEIKEVADNITVLRRGKHIKTFSNDELKFSEFSKLLVGHEVITPVKTKLKLGKAVLRVSDLTVYQDRIKKLNGVSFSLMRGEILAVAGVEGNGQTQLANAIAGLQRPSKGNIEFEDNQITRKKVKYRDKLGLSFVPEDRQKHGLVLDLKVFENIMIKKYSSKKYSFLGLMNKRKMKHDAQAIIKNFDVRGSSSGNSLARSLSGGNQQKVIVGREISFGGDVLIAFQPTRGLDIGAIKYIHEQLLRIREEGKSVLLISYELDEILTLADRVIILNKGEVTGELVGNDINKKNIGERMSQKGNSYD